MSATSPVPGFRVIDAVFEQVRGEAVAQGVGSDALVDIGGFSGLDNDTAELPGADRGRGALSGEQPALRQEHTLLSPCAPPVAQQQEQAFGQHGGRPCRARSAAAYARCRYR